MGLLLAIWSGDIMPLILYHFSDVSVLTIVSFNDLTQRLHLTKETQHQEALF